MEEEEEEEREVEAAFPEEKREEALSRPPGRAERTACLESSRGSGRGQSGCVSGRASEGRYVHCGRVADSVDCGEPLDNANPGVASVLYSRKCSGW